MTACGTMPLASLGAETMLMRLIAQMEPFDKYLRVCLHYIAVAGASLELALLLSVLVSIPSAAPERRPNVLGNLLLV